MKQAVLKKRVSYRRDFTVFKKNCISWWDPTKVGHTRLAHFMSTELKRENIIGLVIVTKYGIACQHCQISLRMSVSLNFILILMEMCNFLYLQK